MISKFHNRWTDAQTELARKMLREDYSEEAFQKALGRSKKASQNRIRAIDYPREKQARLDRHGLHVMTNRGHKIPDEVLADRARRLAAELTITASCFGDPRPGQSALDKREACV